MDSVEVQTLIRARGSTIWEVLTDAGNFPVWNSGITTISGEIRSGGLIRIRTRAKTRTRLRIQQIPGITMTWAGGVPPLFSFIRTCILAPDAGTTLLIVRDELRGPLRSVFQAPWPITEQHLTGFVTAVRIRAEILDGPFRADIDT